MRSAESLSIIYGLLLDVEGPASARETVSSVLEKVILQIQADGLTMRAQLLDERLEEIAQKFIEAARNNVA